MELSYILTFLGGIVADIARKVIAPQTEEWLEQFLPYKRKKRNIQENLLELEVRERLKRLGHDPAIARHVTDDSENFFRRLDQRQEAHREAVVEAETERVLAYANTQLEMNLAAAEHLRESERKLSNTIEELRASAGLSQNALNAFETSQAAWEAYKAAQGEFEGLAQAEGGSMQPMVQAMAMADITIERNVELEEIRKLVTER